MAVFDRSTNTTDAVAKFATLMEHTLSLHRDRGGREGWLIETPDWLFRRAMMEVGEVAAALMEWHSYNEGRQWSEAEWRQHNEVRHALAQECADVGNLLMMLADRVGGLE